MSDLYVDIILPVPLQKLFTYSVPFDMSDQVRIGSRVVVPFGKKKQYSGIIAAIHKNAPEEYEVKPIYSVLDDLPVVNTLQLKMWSWIADYYQCTQGEVYKAALPSGLKLESETRIIYNSEFDAEVNTLTERENEVLNFVASQKMCSILEVNSGVSIKNALPVLKRLMEVEAIFVNEKLREGFKAKKEKFLVLSDRLRSNAAMSIAFDNLSRAPKQLEVLMNFIMLVGGASDANLMKEVSRKELLEKQDAVGALNELIKKEILVQFEKEVGRLENVSNTNIRGINDLSEPQQEAYDAIKLQFEDKDTVLLHGVTSSGKTEIYIHLIQEQLKLGKQVLYLVPEIALTTQIMTRLRRVFGDKLGVYHSRYSDAERVEVWNNIVEGNGYEVVLGVRSSIFLPFSNLGLMIVDEEHENSFKQFDPAPRYNARDVAQVLARMHGAKVLLGTATPSVETYYNTQIGKFGLVELITRYEGIKMPEIIAVDVKDARKRKQMKSVFSPTLLNKMEHALNMGEQVILFQNRRGFAPYIECGQCAWVPKCTNCDVSMTYHKPIDQLICHYCGFSYSVPHTCSACGNPALDSKGFGTQKIEEEIKEIFPEARVGRMDMDTTRAKGAYERIITEFELKHINVLIGTQMISKGLDFDSVSVVGILNADNMLNQPDFRAFERSFQLMAQVSGRAGRKGNQGTVILQTSNATHPVIVDVINNNFQNHYQAQLQERELFHYPPFYRLISLTIKHRDTNVVNQSSFQLGNMLRTMFGDRVLGPQAPVIARIQTYHIRKVLLKFERSASLPKVKSLVQEAVNRLVAQQSFRSVVIQIDVDPL